MNDVSTAVVSTAATPKQPLGTRRASPRTRRTWLWCYAFMIPAGVLGAMFTFYPMVMSWVYSFQDWSGYTDSGTFNGLANYRELIGDPMFWNAFGKSMIFMVVGAPIRIVLALLVAIALNSQIVKMAPVIRTFFFMPVVTTAAVVGIVMTFVLGPYDGPVNTVLTGLGLVDEPVNFLADSDTALWTVIGVHIWKNFGITMIYWLAALQTVPQEYYEAAKVDGAGKLALVRHITVPILVPFAIVIIILTARENLYTFALVQAMTGGGPFFSTQVMEVYIFQTAFSPEGGGQPRLGYASAAGCFFGVVTLVIVLGQLWAVKRVNQTRSQLKSARGGQ